MAYEDTLPMNVPEKGFYYHYKHDPAGTVNNYAYEVMGIGEDTEARDTQFVVYRPLSTDSPAWQKGRLFYLRPLEMFMEEVEKEGKRLPRFTRITEPALLAQLEALRSSMYTE